MINAQGLYQLHINIKVPEEQVTEEKLATMVSSMRLRLSLKIIKSTLAA